MRFLRFVIFWTAPIGCAATSTGIEDTDHREPGKGEIFGLANFNPVPSDSPTCQPWQFCLPAAKRKSKQPTILELVRTSRLGRDDSDFASAEFHHRDSSLRVELRTRCERGSDGSSDCRTRTRQFLLHQDDETTVLDDLVEKAAASEHRWTPGGPDAFLKSTMASALISIIAASGIEPPFLSARAMQSAGSLAYGIDDTVDSLLEALDLEPCRVTELSDAAFSLEVLRGIGRSIATGTPPSIGGADAEEDASTRVTQAARQAGLRGHPDSMLLRDSDVTLFDEYAFTIGGDAVAFGADHVCDAH